MTKVRMSDILFIKGGNLETLDTKEHSAPPIPPAALPAQSVERLIRAIDLLNRRQTLWFSFWHGLVVGIGSTVGVAVILSLALALLNYLDFIPGIERIQELLQVRNGR
jgi:hypothetical protein